MHCSTTSPATFLKTGDFQSDQASANLFNAILKWTLIGFLVLNVFSLIAINSVLEIRRTQIWVGWWS